MGADCAVSFHLPLVTAIKGHFLVSKAATDRVSPQARRKPSALPHSWALVFSGT